MAVTLQDLTVSDVSEGRTQAEKDKVGVRPQQQALAIDTHKRVRGHELWALGCRTLYLTGQRDWG
ncbi:uncharacterized protein N7458_003778 [Penicillium daleae]|uniref:Uncharacterized protein n=1 Tax=Penicillium daleae TaxID=63821 RepID=A0AAD6G3Z7_9EURO|nr:uncharacterized protein N7458_003778 [Penicillium daleae]KAJ5455514.1 hypothetical protein N7458_003778 [Penicillium daleae]